MEKINTVDQQIVKKIMFIVIGDEKKNLRTEKHRGSQMIDKHIETIKELINAN